MDRHETSDVPGGTPADEVRMARICARTLARESLEDGDPPFLIRERVLAKMREVIAERCGDTAYAERIMAEYQRGLDDVLGPER